MVKDVFSVVLPGRAIIRVGGQDAAGFLQGLISCDVHKVSEDKATLGAMLTPQGKFLFDFFLFKVGNDFWLDTQSDRADAFLKKLSLYRLRAKVELEMLETVGVMASVGAKPETKEEIVLPDPRHEAMGWRVYGTKEALKEATDAFSRYDLLRITLGLPDGSRDAEVERTILLENGYDKLGAVDFNKGCYVGQEVTARSKHRGELRKYLFVVSSSQPLPEAGTEIMAGDKAIGVMRSSSGNKGLALVRTDMMSAAQAEGKAFLLAGVPVEITPPWWHASTQAAA